ncbi:MAG: response regulator transcription factor [Synechococcales cyanobacterium]
MLVAVPLHLLSSSSSFPVHVVLGVKEGVVSTTIYILEGNPHLRGLLAWQLEQAGYQVKPFATAMAMQTAIEERSPHLVVIDGDLAEQEGLMLCRWVHQHSHALILILSGRQEEHHHIQALQAGADDYLCKPLSMQMFTAQVVSLVRRWQRTLIPSELSFGDLQIDLVQRRVMRVQQAIDLTPQEFSLLFVLVQSAGTTLSRRELLRRAWSDHTNNPRTVDTHILSLRKKLMLTPDQPSLIETIRNVGYRFCRGTAVPLPVRRPASPPISLEPLLNARMATSG